jgi:hypothetical protein
LVFSQQTVSGEGLRLFRALVCIPTLFVCDCSVLLYLT